MQESIAAELTEMVTAAARQLVVGDPADSLWTKDIDCAHRMARAVHAGTVSVNCYSEGDMTAPFGGYRQSGFGGKEKSLAAFDQWTQTKSVWIQTH